MSLLTSLSLLEHVEFTDPEEVPNDEEEQPITGYQISEGDWQALLAVQRGEQISQEIAAWLQTCDLLTADGKLSDLAKAWLEN